MRKLSLIVPLSRSAFLLGVLISACQPALLGAQEAGDGEGLVELVEVLASATVMAAREADMAARVRGQAASAANLAFEAARDARLATGATGRDARLAAERAWRATARAGDQAVRAQRGALGAEERLAVLADSLAAIACLLADSPALGRLDTAARGKLEAALRRLAGRGRACGT